MTVSVQAKFKLATCGRNACISRSILILISTSTGWETFQPKIRVICCTRFTSRIDDFFFFFFYYNIEDKSLVIVVVFSRFYYLTHIPSDVDSDIPIKEFVYFWSWIERLTRVWCKIAWMEEIIYRWKNGWNENFGHPVAFMVKHAFYSKPLPQFSPQVSHLPWWRMALSTVSFVVGTRIDHRFAIQTELNDGPYSLSALRFISRFTPPRPSFPPPPRRYFSPPPSLPPPKQYPFRSRVHLSVIFREREKRERKKEKKNARVVSTVCKSSDQSGSEDRGERTRERT